MSEKPVHYYSKGEEITNVVTHGIGFILSLIGTILLLIKAVSIGEALYIGSFLTYGLSLMFLYASSTVYHYVQEPNLRRKLNILDHSAIYILIAGTYVPFSLIGIGGQWGTYLFIAVSTVGIIGVILKLFFTGRFSLASTISYVLMGCMVVVAIQPMLQNMSPDAIRCLFIGGIFYIVGAVLYSISRIPYNHAIFHVFVLGGSISHFIGIYCYL